MILNGVEYYYIKNAQGDIIGLFDKTGAQVVSYTYDTWGKLISTTGTLAATVGAKNPYCYRGYRYDTETGLYYLQSRYYNADWGRFINADAIIGQTGDLLGANVFAYCQNNYVNAYDPSGFQMLAEDGGGGYYTHPSVPSPRVPYNYKGAIKGLVTPTALAVAAEKTIGHTIVDTGFYGIMPIPVKLGVLKSVGEFSPVLAAVSLNFSLRDNFSGKYFRGEAWARTAIDVGAVVGTIAFVGCGGWAAVGIGLGIGVLAEVTKTGIDVAFEKFYK